MDIQQRLPVFQHKEEFVQSFLDPNKLVTVVIGETGSGKTTQIPQFVDELLRTRYEDVFPNSKKKKKGVDCIAVTQPRRVAAISVSQRVADEMGCKLGTDVGYQVRFDEKCSHHTRVKFVTDGLLVRESLQDSRLDRYTTIIIDEAHERSLDSDIALGIVRDLICDKPLNPNQTTMSRSSLSTPEAGNVAKDKLGAKLATLGCRRSDMRVVVMSATLADPRKFVDFFGGPSNVNVLGIPGRTFPVDVNYLNMMEEDLREAVCLAAIQLHLELPPGDMLIFLPGQEDILTISHTLENVNKRIAQARLVRKQRAIEARREELKLLHGEEEAQRILALEDEKAAKEAAAAAAAASASASAVVKDEVKKAPVKIEEVDEDEEGAGGKKKVKPVVKEEEEGDSDSSDGFYINIGGYSSDEEMAGDSSSDESESENKQEDIKAHYAQQQKEKEEQAKAKAGPKVITGFSGADSYVQKVAKLGANSVMFADSDEEEEEEEEPVKVEEVVVAPPPPPPAAEATSAPPKKKAKKEPDDPSKPKHKFVPLEEIRKQQEAEEAAEAEKEAAGLKSDRLLAEAISKKEEEKLLALGGPVGLGEEVKSDCGLSMLVMTLYASMPLERQRDIFKPTPPGMRKIVLCTNIAETSVTVPGVRYVIDSGREKVKMASPTSGVDCLKEQWVSRSSALQRSGRAGREAPGRVFRMYVEDVFEKQMAPAPIPELQRVALDGVMLTLLSIGKDPATFAYMDAPGREFFVAATKTLKNLAALDRECKLTEVGRKMAQLPVAPLFAKLLLESVSLGCTKEVLTLVAMMAEGTVWFSANPTGSGSNGNVAAARSQEEALTRARSRIFDPQSDHITLIKLYEGWENAKDKHGYAAELRVSHQALVRAQRVRQQLLGVIQKNLGLNSIASCGDDRTPVRRALAHAFVLHSAALKSSLVGGATGGAGANGIGAARAYVTHVNKQEARVHPGSVLFNSRRPAELVIFGELLETKAAPNLVTVTAVEKEWLEETNLFVKTAQ